MITKRNGERVRKLLDTAPQTLADKRQVLLNVSSEAVDRAGDIVVQAGIDTRDFMATGGTVLWQHDPMQPIARALECKIVNGKLRALVQFPPANVSRTADEVYGLILANVVNSASIGFKAVESEPVDPARPYAGRRFLRSELMEFSFVSIPCAPEATIIARSAFAKAGRVLSGSNAALLGALQERLDKGEKCSAKALDLIEKARLHHAMAQRHAAAIAASASDYDVDPDSDDANPDDPQSDVELSALIGRLQDVRRLDGDAGQRRHRRETALAYELGLNGDPDAARRRREVEVLALAAPAWAHDGDEAAARRRRQIEILELSAPRQ